MHQTNCVWGISPVGQWSLASGTGRHIDMLVEVAATKPKLVPEISIVGGTLSLLMSIRQILLNKTAPGVISATPKQIKITACGAMGQ